MHYTSLLLLVLLAGCVGGPSYSGGPTTDQPHAIVDPGVGVHTWKVDGRNVDTRTGEIYVAPGLRKVLVRVWHPVESDERPHEPYDMKTIPIHAEAGTVYTLDRLRGEFAPFKVDIRQYKSN